MREFRRECAVVAAFSFATNLLMLAPSLYMLQVFDRVMASKSELTLLAVSLVALFLFALMAVTEWARSQLLVRVGARLDDRLSARVFVASFESALGRAGGNPIRSFSDLAGLRQFMTGGGVFAFFDAPWTPIYLGVLFVLHPVAGAVATLFALLLACTTWLAHRLTRASNARVLESTAAIDAFLHSKLRNAEVIQALGMRDPLRARWNGHQRHLLQASTHAQERQHVAQAVSKFVRYAEQSLMLAAGALLVIQAEMTVGGMIVANVLMGRALAPIDQFTGNWRGFVGARDAWRSLDALLRAHPQDDSTTKHATAPTGQVRLHGLAATVPDGRTVFRAGDTEFTAGEVTAVIGHSGSGKSTLARALVGIWPGLAGSVLLDGVPIDAWDRGELGPHIGYLPQDVELLEGSIAENIARFGAIDSDKVIEAAMRTGIHDMVLRFPAGYDTPVGEAGGALSAGQRQRIALARALYGSPALVVLDEPDANLDEAGTIALAETLRQLKRMKRTVVMITHRMSLVESADRILVLAGGEIRLHGARGEILAAMQSPNSHPGRPLSPQPA